MRLTLLIGLLIAPTVLADPKTEPADPKAPVAREITGVDLTPSEKTGDRTVKIKSKEELQKVFSAKSAEEIAKKIDFSREYLVAFFWSGSGRDKLSFKVEKGEGGDKVVFTKALGRTRDLRRHRKLFAIPLKMTYSEPK